jgi:hypothetical protein
MFAARQDDDPDDALFTIGYALQRIADVLEERQNATHGHP